MPVDSTHPEYLQTLDSWTLMRDVLQGPAWVKAKRVVYLPCPSGMAEYTVDPNGQKRYSAGPAYNAYLKRARFPDIVSPTLRGLLGCFYRKPAVYELPPRMGYLIDGATVDGITLDALVSRIMRETLSTGRCPLLVDVPINGGLPYLVQYRAEDLINWRCITTSGREQLQLAVLCGAQSVPNADDIYQSDAVLAYRGLLLKDGRYVQELYERHENNLQFIGTIEPRVMGGRPLPFIPLVIIGSMDTTPDIDLIPLYGIAEIAISMYQQYADYRQSLYMTSQPTAVVSGINSDQTPDTIGASSVWTFEQPDARAYFLEFGGAGVGAQRQAIQDELSEAASIGAQMLEASRRTAESGEALRLRQGAVTATLLSVVDAVEAGLTQALKYAAEWIGANPADVRVELNRDFLEEDLDPQKLQALVAAWQSQAISQTVLFHNLRRMELVPDGMTDEEMMGEIETESPILLSEPEAPEIEEDDDEEEDDEDSEDSEE